METINGEWIMKGCVSSDPSALHVAEGDEYTISVPGQEPDNQGIDEDSAVETVCSGTVHF